MAAVPRPRRRRRRRRLDAARAWSTTEQRRLGRRPARPRLVVADRLGRSRVRHVRREHQTPSRRRRKGIFGNDYAAELEKQGLSEDEIVKRVVARDIELTSESGDDQLHGRWRSTRRPARSSGSARRTAGRRPAAAIARTPTRPRRRPPTASGSTPRSAATSASSATRSTARCCGSTTWTPQPIYLDFGTASSPVVHDGRVYQLHDNDGESFLAALDAKTGKELWTVKRTDLDSRLASGWATPFIWKQRASAPRSSPSAAASSSATTLDGRELWRLKGMTQATPSPVAAGRAALRRIGIAGRGQPAAVRGAARRDGRHLPQGRRDVERVRRVVAAALLRLHAVAARLSRPGLCGERQRHPAGRRRRRPAPRSTRRASAAADTRSRARRSRASGRIYVASEDGDVFVLARRRSLRRDRAEQLGEMSLASPAAAGDSLYVRTQTKLYCLR